MPADEPRRRRTDRDGGGGTLTVQVVRLEERLAALTDTVNAFVIASGNRVGKIEDRIGKVEDRQDQTDNRLTRLVAGLAVTVSVAVLIAQLIAPFILQALNAPVVSPR